MRFPPSADVDTGACHIRVAARGFFEEESVPASLDFWLAQQFCRCRTLVGNQVLRMLPPQSDCRPACKALVAVVTMALRGMPCGASTARWTRLVTSVRACCMLVHLAMCRINHQPFQYARASCRRCKRPGCDRGGCKKTCCAMEAIRAASHSSKGGKAIPGEEATVQIAQRSELCTFEVMRWRKTGDHEKTANESATPVCNSLIWHSFP